MPFSKYKDSRQPTLLNKNRTLGIYLYTNININKCHSIYVLKKLCNHALICTIRLSFSILSKITRSHIHEQLDKCYVVRLEKVLANEVIFFLACVIVCPVACSLIQSHTITNAFRQFLIPSILAHVNWCAGLKRNKNTCKKT